MFNKFMKTKYKIIVLNQEYNTMNVVRIIKTTKLPEKVRIDGNKTYLINNEFPSYSHKLEKIYFIDYKTGNQILFDTIKRVLNPNELDLILSTNIVKDLAIGVMDNKKEKIIWLIIGLIIGGLITAVLLMNYYQSQINEFYQNPISNSSVIVYALRCLF